jgi:hypothetical protein
MKDTYQKIYQGFCDNTKTSFYLNAFAILLIFLFMVGPMQTTGITHTLARLLIISLLSYSLYTNVISSNSLLNIESVFVNPSLAIVKNNFLLNVAFSIMIFVFILHLIAGIF